MKRSSLLNRNIESIKDGKHECKVLDIHPMVYGTDVPMEERKPKMLINIIINGTTLHTVFAPNERQCIDNVCTMSIYDNIIFGLLDQTDIAKEIVDNVDDDNPEEIIPLLKGKVFPCWVITNEASNGKAYKNVVFTETQKVKDHMQAINLLAEL